MKQEEFEQLLGRACERLTAEAKEGRFNAPAVFENRVREVLRDLSGYSVDFNPHPQAFPDVDMGDFGVEVKFTLNDAWRSVANSVLETNRIESVKKVYLVFGKMGGKPEVRWGDYEKSVCHVRTSHVPRFEVELSTEHPLFELMGVKYDDFRKMSMEDKMRHIRGYARGRLQQGERLWWLEDKENDEHTLPIQVRLYTHLPMEEKTRLRAEAVLLCPSVVKPSGAKNKYDDAVLYLLTYHGVLCHQARDLFSAGSVANPFNDDEGGIYIARALQLLEDDMKKAALVMDDELFVEYWSESVSPKDRIRKWLEKADEMAKDWKPSETLFAKK
ncbi:MAG: hypothetical protein LBT45_03555 [Rickettsiales bacterium]|jgi:hypothetical protein|nr:hypothetical protein [Rickettsiales bacterium]